MESEKDIFSSFERIFAKLMKRAFNVQELEQLRAAIHRIVAAVRKIADRSALERCKRLNDAVLRGFTRVSGDMVDIEMRLDKLEGKKEPPGVVTPVKEEGWNT